MKAYFTIKPIRLGLVVMMAVICGLSANSSMAQNVNRDGEQQFFETLNELPLMPGLYELLDESVVFDKPDGRIVESSAASQYLAGTEIQSFYQQTLPQMGWQRIAPQSYVRQGEALDMKVENDGDYSIVRFTLAPRTPESRGYR